MSPTELFVVLGAVAAIAWVNWYFLLSVGPGVEVAAGTGGLREVRIRVAGGYDPAVVRVERGSAVRLIFDRRETSGCSEEVVLPDFGIRRFLPPFEETVVEFTPDRSGTYEFTCGMGMLRGKVVVE